MLSSSNVVVKMAQETDEHFLSGMLIQAEPKCGQIASRGLHWHHVKGIKSTDLHGVALYLCGTRTKRETQE